MEISDERIGGTCVVTVKGRLDGGASAAFADRVSGLIKGTNPKLLIDLSGVDFVTSAGLRAVLLLVKRIKAADGAFALCGVQDSVREVLDITGFTSMLIIHRERGDAIAAFGG